MKEIFGFVAAFFVLVFVINWWQWILVGAAVIALGLGAWWLGEKVWFGYKARMMEKRRRDQELRDNAAIQHQLCLQGDKSAIYGMYQPVNLDRL